MVVKRHSNEHKEEEKEEEEGDPSKNISISLISSKNDIWLTCRVEPENTRRLTLLVLSGYLTDKEITELPLVVNIRGGRGSKWTEKVKQVLMIDDFPWK